MPKSTHTPEYRALRRLLTEMREAAGLSQRALSAQLGMPPSWTGKVETGDRRIDLVEFCWFCLACGRDPAATASTMITQMNPRKPRAR